MKKYKSVILYKLGRFQEDFEYMFPNIKIKKYIVDENRKSLNGIECIKFKALEKKFKGMIVICDRKKSEITNMFVNAGLVENKTFMYLEDFGIYLDEKPTLKEKIINTKYKKKYNIDLEKKGMSNSELFKKMIYTDSTHNLKCTEPFRTAVINPGGFVYLCNPGTIKEHIGSVFHKSGSEVWNSTRAKLFRLSAVNKTYAFCKLNLCRLAEIENNNDKTKDLVTPEIPEYTALAYDKSCNFKCRSCRSCLINYNNDKVQTHISNVITQNLFKSKWLSNTRVLVMSTHGEVFFSKVYQDILYSDKLTNILALIIHTNGNLLTEEKTKELCDKFHKKGQKNININISVDSLNDETYKFLRPGGNLKLLKKNLEYISKARQEGNIFCVNFVVVLQKFNYKELPEIAKYAIDLKVDRLDVQTITNWGTYTDEEFKDVCMYDEFGKPKPELVEILKDPIFQSKEIEFVGNVFKKESYME